MSYVWNPTTDYRFSLKKGMKGNDVAALQVNLEIEVDGDFGPITRQAVISYQKQNDLVHDGIAGLITQQALCIEHSTPAARSEQLPVGLLKSLMANESGFAVGAVSRHPSDAGLDVGAFQRSTGPWAGSQDFYRYAFDVRSAAYTSATEIRGAHDAQPQPVSSRYLDELAANDTDRFRWLMATLAHNWPVASHNIPRYGRVFRYDTTADDREAEWIVQASGGRLHTPREWVTAYVIAATKFVDW